MERIKQKTDEWLTLRRGKFTASSIYKLMGKKFGNELSDWPDTAQTYIMSKVAESFSDRDHELSTVEIRWGNEHEPIARAYYEGLYGEQVEQVGFILWPRNVNAGCSPDGLVMGKHRGIEIKCPYTINSHLESFLIRTNSDFKDMKPMYYWQVMSSMLFTGLERWDFVSYHPYFKPQQRMSCIEIVADTTEFEQLAARIEAAVIVRDKLIEQVLNG